MIVPILIGIILIKFKNLEHPLIPLLLVATFFSFMGDLLFIVTVEESLFKLLGLCTFIVSKVAYVMLYFLSSKNTRFHIVSWNKRWPEIITIFILLGAFFYFSKSLGDFFLPGLIYGMVSVLAVLMALNRRFYVSRNNYSMVIRGALFFLVSDIFMGMNFSLKDGLWEGLTLVFYVMGHWFVTYGLMEQFTEEVKEEKTNF
ncbi:hypothetical protein P872_18020 [Rhodonellum psychrophilum GCM71 = DSM 17998]|uniref:YhhN-like protein n=2 Tax=Rhodonellum TaxID=336827 RepID=U5C0H9_9BACT|nr:hypothetical protein P872_18020 [Rhodonellum psychrophilum GCM71 = DSM 17998]